MNSSLLIHAATAGHIGFFQFLVMINKADVNSQMPVFVLTYIFNSMGKYLGIMCWVIWLRLSLDFQ